MNLSFCLQCVFYDRLRLLHHIKHHVATIDDLRHYITTTYHSDNPFKRQALNRMDELSTVQKKMAIHNIHWLDSSHTHYPEQLAFLDDAPLGLFYVGNPAHLTDSLMGIVGTRRPSINVSDRLRSIVAMMTGHSTLSGGAMGIDAMVHDYSLTHRIPTVCILASGLDYMTPRINQALFERVITSNIGCIVAECPPGVRPKPYYFPHRNRLIAILANKLIVVEATKRSGAVLTANLSAGFGRDVAAIVGGYNAPQSEGCYDLINDGAYAIGNSHDLNEFLGLIHTGHAVVPSAASCGDDQLLTMIPSDAIHIEELAHKLTIPLGTLIEHVTRLSLNGAVTISSGQMIQRSC